MLLCNQLAIGDVAHSIAIRSNTIAIMFHRFESAVRLLKAYRSMALGMPLTEVSRACNL